ncbi:MAG: bestrophin family ion channel [Chitinophagaceae bacterium]
MLITHNLHLLRILRYTWKVDLVMIVTCAATYLIREYILLSSIQIPATLVTLLGTAIAFFIGFNNNQAYDRWWEARIIWGALVNDSRTWARNILVHTTEGKSDSNVLLETKKRMIFRHISFVYSLKDKLRESNSLYYEKYLEDSEKIILKKETNISNALLTLHSIDLQMLSDNQSIDGFRFLQLNQLITNFTDQLGKSERIKNTVFPTNYIYFTRLFIWALVIFTTLILSDLVGGWSIFIGWIVGFIFHVAHQNGMSLMEPFDEIPYGIPLNQMSRTIEINLLEMLGETEIPKSVQPVNNEYIM